MRFDRQPFQYASASEAAASFACSSMFAANARNAFLYHPDAALPASVLFVLVVVCLGVRAVLTLIPTVLRIIPAVPNNGPGSREACFC